MVLAALEERMGQVGLSLHPDKTRVVYCKDGKRRGPHEHVAFTLLGVTVPARSMRGRPGNVFPGFGPAGRKEALKKISGEVGSRRPAHPPTPPAEIVAAW